MASLIVAVAPNRGGNSRPRWDVRYSVGSRSQILWASGVIEFFTPSLWDLRVSLNYLSYSPLQPLNTISYVASDVDLHHQTSPIFWSPSPQGSGLQSGSPIYLTTSIPIFSKGASISYLYGIIFLKSIQLDLRSTRKWAYTGIWAVDVRF